jgi:putative redox protein
MSQTPAPVSVALEWQADLRFSVTSGPLEFAMDSGGNAGPSPMQALAAALAGCMAIDLVHILTKGRWPLEGLRVTLNGRRAESPPRRFEQIELRFAVEGDVPADQVERAIALSREKYCSVWHTLRPDIAFDVAFDVTPAGAPAP